MGLTGNLRGKTRTSAKAKSPYTVKKRGRPPKETTAAVAVRRGRKSGQTIALENLEAEIDRLLFQVMGIGDLPEVEQTLRQARRLLYGGFSRG
jgi:hypothetical protein